MCLLDSVENRIDQDLDGHLKHGSSFQWQPIRINREDCLESTCSEEGIVSQALVKFFEREVERAFAKDETSGTVQIVTESNYSKEFESFSEVQKITNNSTLSQEEKLIFLSRPLASDIRLFLKSFFKFGHVNIEVQIYALILLNRLLKKACWKLRATNWRILFLTAVRIAQKFEAVPVLDAEELSYLYPLFSPKEFNRLEINFLKVIDYHCFVTTDEFAMELRRLVKGPVSFN